MKGFIHLAMPTGHVYQLPTQAIANHRAAYYHRARPEEFPTLEAALDDTVGLFDDASEIKDWATGNMNWDTDIAPHAQLVRFDPPEQDWSDAEWSFRDSPHAVAPLEGETLNQMPLQMVLNSMSTENNICNVMTLDGPQGPIAALAVFQGGPQVVGSYIHSLQITTDLITQNAPAPAPTH